jgi:protoporphyrinogen/coproporphyrinogen III oxidase
MTRRIIIVGGGIAGLAAAHRLVELKQEKGIDLEIVLLEASARLGGSIITERVGEFLVEAGPDSFITEKPWALRLCERVNLTSQLIPTNAAFHKLYVVRRGKLQELPKGFLLLAPTRFWPFIRTPLFSWLGKLRIAAEIFVPQPHSDRDESLASFVRRRFGEEALTRVAQPLIGGIYAADPERLSLAATMPRFKEMERRGRSLIWSMWREQKNRDRHAQSGSGARWGLFVSLTGGMQELVDTIAKRLPTAAVRLNRRVTSLERGTGGAQWHVTTANLESFDGDAVILASPAYQSAEILRSVEPNAATELGKISYASTATVTLAYRESDFPRAPDSFGFVVPAIENRKIMACTFSSLKFAGRAPQGHVLLRAFIGGSLQSHLFEDDNETMERNVREELSSLLGTKAQPLFCRTWRHSLSMPQYHLGHRRRIDQIEARMNALSGLILAGSAYHGVGISDCVRSGEEAAEKIVQELCQALAGRSLTA